MATGIDYPTFYDRFEDLRRQLRRYLCVQTVCGVAICWLLGLMSMAVVDYWFELSWTIRATGFAGVGVLALVIGFKLLERNWRHTARENLSAQIERRFPELGQRVRTTLTFQGLSSDELTTRGLAPGLVRALETAVAVSTLPLPLESLIPRRKLVASLIAGSVIILAVLATWLLDDECHTALRRALLADDAYSQLFVANTDNTVDHGSEVSLVAGLRGRFRERVVLRTRAVGANDASWQERVFSTHESEREMWHGWWFFDVTLPNLAESFEYQWIAGPEQSEVLHIVVRQPPRIVSATLDLTPPSYTRMPVMTGVGPQRLTVLEGSIVKWIIDLDCAATSARLRLTSLDKDHPDNHQPEMIEARIEGTRITFEKTLSHDVEWLVEAASPDGLSLLPQAYRIRVRQDQPPAITFESPPETLDVHSLAEIAMRIKVRDDYGITRAGIVFQINNDQEHTLIAEDFAAKRTEKSDQSPSPTTATLERVLPLEHFHLIQKDSITYYAFAEDNRPGQLQRTETELRFIDIRPFKSAYRRPPNLENQGGNDDSRPRRATFEELIGRQRTALNRTMALKRHSKIDFTSLEQLTNFEVEIAEWTSELGKFLQVNAQQFELSDLDDNAELLFQAERKMLDSVDSLSVGNFEVAVLQQKDAVRLLVESRDRLTIFLEGADSPSGFQDALNRYFRMQLSKIRMRNKNKKGQEDETKLFLAELSQLLSQQLMLADQLDMLTENNDSANESDHSKSSPSVVGAATPQDVAKAATEDMSPATHSTALAEFEARQLLLVERMTDVQTEFDRLAQATKLSQQRMTEVKASAESTRAELSQMHLKRAQQSARNTVESLERVFLLAQGLLAPELADQIGVARDLAEDLRQRENDLAKNPLLHTRLTSIGTSTNSAENDTLKEQAKVLYRHADRLALDAEALADILQSATKSAASGDQKFIPQLVDLLGQGGLTHTIERIQQQPARIQAAAWEHERIAALELEERLDQSAQQLDALQREIIQPRLADLMKREQMAGKLAAQAVDVETRTQAEHWYRALGQLLQELQEDGTTVKSDAPLKEEMKAQGWDETTNTLQAVTRTFEAEKIQPPLQALGEEIRAQVQQLLLKDLKSNTNETSPPQYEELVLKYQRALARGTANHDQRSTPRLQKEE